MTIFKAYDVRGVYPTQINERAAYEIGRRLKILNIKKIAVAKDARLSSDTLANSLIEGLLDSGIDVYDIGLASSPILSHFSAKYKMHGAMITASHNPKEYNGIKLVDKNAVQISYEDGLDKIERSMNKKTPKKERPANRGELVHKRILNEYADYIEGKFKKTLHGKKTLKVVFDCSNGVGGLPLFMLSRLNINPIIINNTPDGRFPNHPCDQTKKENLAQLQAAVIKNQADLGVMFDGDADRCAFVDEKGRIIQLDIAFLLLAIDAIKEYTTKSKKKSPKPKILFDLRFSKAVAEYVEENAGTPVMMRVGNPFYKKKMKKDKSAIVAGELSGHIMFADNYGIDDPLYATLKMAGLLAGSKTAISEKIKSYTKYYSSGEINYSLEDRSKTEKIIKKITESYVEKKQLRIDGITILDKDWWMNIRASNTEPVLRLIIEGISKNVVDAQKKVVEYLISR